MFHCNHNYYCAFQKHKKTLKFKSQHLPSIILEDLIVHFTVTGGNEARVDLVLIQPFLLCYVNHFVLMLTSIFKYNFHKKRKEVCIKTRSTSASHSFKG